MMLASDFTGLMEFLTFGPAVLLFLALIGLAFTIRGSLWAVLFILAAIIGGGFFGSFVLFWPDQVGAFLCFWMPTPFILGVASSVTLFFVAVLYAKRVYDHVV
jgi:hypothetical protein